MAKIVIEVSDGYIHERADVNNMKQQMESGKDLTGLLADYIAFSSLETKIQAGQTEFYMSSKDYMEQDIRKLFNNAVGMCTALILTINKHE